MADAPDRAPIGFEEFGVRFVHAAVTPARIGKQLQSAIGPLPIAREDKVPGLVIAFGAGAVTRVEVVGLTPDALQPDAAYEARLTIHLHLSLVALGLTAQWEGDFTVPLVMTVQAFSPLELDIVVRPLAAKDIAAAMIPTDWLAGNAWITDQVRAGVTEAIATQVNAKVAAAYQQLRIDVLAQLKAIDVPDDPSGAPGPGIATKPISLDPAKPTPILAGESFRGDIPAGERGYLQVLVDPSVRLRLTMGARVSNGSQSGAILYFKLVDADENLLDRGDNFAIYENEDFAPVGGTLHADEHRDAALIVLRAESNPLTVRGKLTFEAA